MKITAGIVVFNPNIERLFENISAILSQVDHIIVIDNNSENIIDVEKQLHEKFPSCQIIKNNANFGIAKAFNQIFEIAEGMKSDWVLTLDQDSVCPVTLIENYLKGLTRSIGVMSPVITYENTQIQYSGVQEFQSIDWCISSASLISVQSWQLIGGFDEKMFIDMVDYDFCYRLRDVGKKIIRCNNIKIYHELGNGREHSFFGKKIYVGHHSAFRHFYFVRNSYYLYKKRELSLVSLILSVTKLAFKIILFESNKINKLSKVLQGLNEGRKM